jgi:hypothetical protein
VTYINPDEDYSLYNTIVKHVLNKKEKAMIAYGAKIVEANPPPAVGAPTGVANGCHCTRNCTHGNKNHPFSS